MWNGLPEEDIKRGRYLAGLQSYLLNVSDRRFLVSLDEAAKELPQKEKPVAPMA